jgi:hypothetical protein
LNAGLTAMAEAAKPCHGMCVIDAQVVTKAYEMARSGNLTVAVTCCLFHVHVTVPKLKGDKANCHIHVLDHLCIVSLHLPIQLLEVVLGLLDASGPALFIMREHLC